MTHRKAAITMTLSNIQGHSPIANLLRGSFFSLIQQLTTVQLALFSLFILYYVNR